MERAAAMQLAKAEAEDYLRTALQMIEETLAGSPPLAQVDRVHALATSYVQLAGEAINRFQKAAHGA